MGRRHTARGRPWPWPWCGGWWMHQALKRGSAVRRSSGRGFQIVRPSVAEACRRGDVNSVLVDSQTLMFCLEFKSVVFDAALAEEALRHFLSHFERTKLIFAFPEPGPKDGPNHRGLGLGGEPEHYKRFDGIEPQAEHEATQLGEMENYRLRRSQLGDGIELSGHDAVFFREWFTRRATELGHEVCHVEGVNDHYQQLAMLARDRRVDFVLSTYPDFYVFDMGRTGYIQFQKPYPLGLGSQYQPTFVFRGRKVAEELGVPLAGLRELSCLLGNHLLRPTGSEPLARFLDDVKQQCRLNNVGVVQYFVDEVRARWRNGQSYSFEEQVNYLHRTTDLDKKLLIHALDFYCIEGKHPNNVWSATFPLLKQPSTHKSHIDHLKFLDVCQFKETRLRAQYGDAFIRRHNILEPLRAFKYGLLMMSSNECCGDVESLDEDAPEICISKEHFVVEHRVDYASRARHGDSVEEYEVAAQLPKFAFVHSEFIPCAGDILSAAPLCEAFANADSLEYAKRQEYYLTLFGAKTPWVQVLPPKLIPVAAALRFLARLDILGMDKAIGAFIEHVAVLQHGGREAFQYSSRRFNRRRKSGGIPQPPDERSFGLFYVILHCLYKAMVELNELCGWPYPQVPPFEAVFDYNVYTAIRANGVRLGSEEISLEAALHKAVTHGIPEGAGTTKVELGGHDSVWIPADVPHDQRPRAQSVPVVSSSCVTPVRVRSKSTAHAEGLFLHRSPDYLHRWNMPSTRVSISPPKQRPRQPRQAYTPPSRRSIQRNAADDAPGSAPPRRRLFGSDSHEVVRGAAQQAAAPFVSPSNVGAADPTGGGWWRGAGAGGNKPRNKSDADRFASRTTLAQHYGQDPHVPASPVRRPTMHVTTRAPPQASVAVAPSPRHTPARHSVDPGATQGDSTIEGTSAAHRHSPGGADAIGMRASSPSEVAAPGRKSSKVMLTFASTDECGRDRESEFSASITDGTESAGRDRHSQLSSSVPDIKAVTASRIQRDRAKSSANIMQYEPAAAAPSSPARFSNAASRHSLSRFGGAAAHPKNVRPPQAYQTTTPRMDHENAP